METANSGFVNTLRYFALSYGGFQCALFICMAGAYRDTHWSAPTGTAWEFWLLAVGAVVPPFWASRRDRGWRVKSPFYRISDDCDLLERVERLEQLEQRVTSSS